VAVLLERLTARDGYGFEEACALMQTNHQVTASRAELEAIAGRLPSRPRRRFESDEALEQVPSEQRPIDDGLAEEERIATASRVAQALKAAMAGLDAQDRLILALRFEDGRTVVEMAKMLELDQKALYRRIERVLKTLRGALHAQGVNGAAAMEIFDSPAGRVIDGEGLVSVAAAFLGAGVPSVVASLWPVDDSAHGLLTGFHSELLSRRDSLEALRAAQLSVLRARGPHLPVRDWGGFVARGGSNASVNRVEEVAWHK
jgi:RNA polymerase sigma factor (sigma-70 family)